MGVVAIYRMLPEAVTEVKKPMSVAHILLLSDSYQVVGEYPQFGQRKFKVAAGPLPTTISVKYTIDISSSSTVDAFKLATKCLEFWEKFIREQVQSKTGTK